MPWRICAASSSEPANWSCAVALVELLASSAFRDRLAPMPGYDLTASGEAA